MVESWQLCLMRIGTEWGEGREGREEEEEEGEAIVTTNCGQSRRLVVSGKVRVWEVTESEGAAGSSSPLRRVPEERQEREADGV